jgi:hypothetical protein
MGSGIDNGTVYDLEIYNGEVIAGGNFTMAGGASVVHVARFDGVSWAPLGTGPTGGSGSGWVHALASYGGLLYAGGDFAFAGSISANGIASWNGSAWARVGTGAGGVTTRTGLRGSVRSLNEVGGLLVVGGSFAFAGGLSANCIARWNGATWSAMGAGMNGVVHATCSGSSGGTILAGGLFANADGSLVNNIAEWNGTSWSALNSGTGTLGVNASVNAMVPYGGNFIVGGGFTAAGGASMSRITQWTGSSWTPLGNGVGNGAPIVVDALTRLANGDVIAGGSFVLAGGVAVYNIARWNGVAWSPLGLGLNSWGYAVTSLPNGDTIVGGIFGAAGGASASSIARWSGSAWSSMGTGMNNAVQALTAIPGGDVVAGGSFTVAGGQSANYVARWNGSTWSPFGGGTNGAVQALVVMPSGDLVAGGSFTTADGQNANRIARWNGSSWSAIGLGMDAAVQALAVMPNGDLVAGGSFTTADGQSANRIARWNGSSWSAFGLGMEAAVQALAVMPNGDLVAGGSFTTADGQSANRIARWNGSSWSAFGLGMNAAVQALAVMPTGDLVAGGSFNTAGGQGANFIARWSVSGWSALDSGTDHHVAGLTTKQDGTVVAAGRFTHAGGNVTAFVAHLSSNCPASSSAYGAGSAGAGGPNILIPTSLPWLGAVMRSTATGMPTNGFAVEVLGWSQAATPLSVFTPLGYPGSTVWVSLDFTKMHMPTAGVVVTSLVVPTNLNLVGVAIHQQILSVDITPFGILGISTSNALTHTFGVL